MMSSTTATARSSVPQKNYKGSHTNGAWQRGPTKGQTHGPIVNKKVPKAKSGKPHHQPHHQRQNDSHSQHNVLLHRLSLPSSPPSGTLLERIGGSVEDVDEVPSNWTDPVRITDGECVPSQGADNYTNLPNFSTTPHYYTPEPGEVERFLESVIGATGVPPPPGPSDHACSSRKPTLALETRNLPVDHRVKVEDPSSSVLYSPTQTAVNSLPSANLTLDHCPQSPLLGDTMSPPSASTLEECRKHLVPVLLASSQARDPGKHLDVEQCLRLLSDDHCKHFFRQAKEMSHQLSSQVSQKTPVNQRWSGSPKRYRVDDVDALVRNTRSRLNSDSTVVSDLSRRDSDITLVDFPGGKLPPKAPRAMLQAYQTSANKPLLNAALSEAPYKVLVASPTTEDHPASATPFIDLVHQAIKMFPTFVPTSLPAKEIDTSNAPVGISTGDSHPSQVVSPTPAVPSTSTDFVSHLPTQAGIWFRQQGRRHAEIVDVDIDVSDEMFYMSTERLPFRLRMHLRLCSLPVSAVAKNDSDGTPALPPDVDGVIDHHARHWPKKGTLVVQVNPESERSQTWLPYTLESDPLDVTSCMQPGKNTFRFIQLSDLSEFAFVLAASPPPAEEEWRSWDWASLVERPRSGTGAASSSPTTTTTDDRDAVNGLSEFAQIPVTIRS